MTAFTATAVKNPDSTGYSGPTDTIFKTIACLMPKNQPIMSQPGLMDERKLRQ
jgi:hypothetical protein